MTLDDISNIAGIIKRNQSTILQDWLTEQLSAGLRLDLIRETELRDECQEFLELFIQAVQDGNISNIQSYEWLPVRDLLASISRDRSQKGFTPSETATVVFSLKQPLFGCLQHEISQDDNSFLQGVLLISTLLDKLGLWTTEIYQKSREEVIRRQQEELLELSTPVVKLWGGILALPVIGTLDSVRTQIVMESLLQKILETGSEIAIIDITGVPTVDTLTAQHLLKTVTAARLMGAECFISGVRPQIAQTIVHLGVDLAGIVTKASLADAFAMALKKMGYSINQTQSRL